MVDARRGPRPETWSLALGFRPARGYEPAASRCRGSSRSDGPQAFHGSRRSAEYLHSVEGAAASRGRDASFPRRGLDGASSAGHSSSLRPAGSKSISFSGRARRSGRRLRRSRSRRTTVSSRAGREGDGVLNSLSASASANTRSTFGTACQSRAGPPASPSCAWTTSSPSGGTPAPMR